VPSEAPADQRVVDLLEGLNEPQRAAVVAGDGPLLILAGAGSGKTRVLTHRIAYLIHTQRARAGEILAITFTNKAAAEMRDRVGMLLGHSTRAMWVLTFHSACARILRAEAERLGYTRQFTIYDASDSRRLVKRCLDQLDVDPKRFTPGSVAHQISDAKSKLRSAEDYAQMVGGYFEKTVADAYRLYERELVRMNAMDFDDLLFRMVNVLELFPEVRARYAATFRHVLVDEYQDTNHAQYRLLQLIAGEHKNLAVVGDDAQCLVEGTRVTMGDGTYRPIEDVRPGDMVLSSYGSGDLRPAPVQRVHRHDDRGRGIALTTVGGRRLVSTPEHVHFAGYRIGMSPELHTTYLQWKAGTGFRVGTSGTYVLGQAKPKMGFTQRSLQEKADAAWVVSTHATEADARVDEAIVAAKYGLPTLPFMARRTGAAGSVVGNQELIDRVFAGVDTELRAMGLMDDVGLEWTRPHHRPQTSVGRRRNLTITMCGDRRGQTPMHRIAISGQDEEGRETLERLGLSVRAARVGSRGWRFETCMADAGALLDLVDRISEAMDVSVRSVARLGADPSRKTSGFSLPLTCAAAVRTGMVVFTEDGWDVVAAVEPVVLDRPVFDIDVENTHNFIAEGVLTHNSIYSFRGADIRNILDFQDDFPDATVVKLEQNYRSTQTILSASNALIAHNRAQMHKTLWTDQGEGDPIVVRELEDEHAEARYVLGEVQRLVDEGVSLAEIAVFYRTNAQSRVLEDALVRAEVPYQVIGGTKFYERAEVKDTMAYLTLLSNPADAISFTRVANSPKRGIGQTSLSRVLAHAENMGITVWEAADDPAGVPGLGTAAVRSFERFMSTMNGLRERVADSVPMGDLLEAVLSETGYLDALEAERTIEAQGRIENLGELVAVAREFDAVAPAEADRLDVFLQQIALQSDTDNRKDDAGMVTLMTLHNAKGLEYPIVYMIGCEEGVFPHSRSIDEGTLEEERRLCYVGMTRAMRALTMTHARQRNVFGSRAYGLPSRFLAEIPPDLVERQGALTGYANGAGADRGSIRPRASASWASMRADAAAASTDDKVFRVGEDVLHAAFGEGVVTGVEPGGVVVIRFSKDGSERKLMAEYAPVSKR
jgi:DNA helicase-2/ATP-dependent DNA helicase PcrA